MVLNRGLNMLTEEQTQIKKNCLKNQLELATKTRKYLKHVYFGNNGHKSLFENIPTEVIIIINQLDKLIEKLEKGEIK